MFTLKCHRTTGPTLIDHHRSQEPDGLRWATSPSCGNQAYPAASYPLTVVNRAIEFNPAGVRSGRYGWGPRVPGGAREDQITWRRSDG